MSSFSEIIHQSKPVLVDFFASWCGPCKAMSPILDQVKKEMADTVVILKIDVDKNQKLAAKLNVRGVPTLVIYKKGAIVWRESGVVQKQVIIQKLNEFK